MSGDSRKRLEKNKTIRVYAGSDEDLSSVTFTILEEVGKGSYSVCYEAEELQQNKKGVLKEFYPEKYALQMKRTDERQLCISPECIGTKVHSGFLEERKAYIETHENLQKIQNDKAYADIGEFIPRIEIYRGSRDPDNADASVYLFMQGPQVISFKDICVKERAYMHSPDPHSCLENLLRSVRTLAQAVGYLHEHYLLFTDIKPDNIGFVKTERMRKGYFPEKLQILDLDAICPMIKDDDGWARGTEEFCDPMIAYGATAQTDIYAIGVTLFKAVIFTTEGEIEGKYEDKYYNRLADLVKESKLIKNCSEEVQNQITAILKRCLCDNSDPSRSDRYSSCDVLCRDLDGVLGMLRCGDDICSAEGMRNRTGSETDYRLQTDRIVRRPGFGGREEELQRMEELLLEENTSVLFLQGIGGIGKTELVINYALRHQDNKRHNTSDYIYDQIVFLTYSGNLCSTVSTKMKIKGLIRGREESDEHFFGRKMEILPDITDENTLFIIDNFDVNNDKDLKAFLDGGDYTVIFTTRNPHSSYETLEIGPVGDIRTPEGMQKMIEVFERHRFGRNGKLSDADRESIEELIRLVEGHTYALELLAKKMKADSLSGERLLDEYRQGLRNQQGSSVEGYKNKGMMQPFDHICAVFDVSHIGAEEEQLLMELSLMDLQGISRDLFKNWTQVPRLMESINTLENRGLLRKGGENGEIISLHPLVRKVVQEKLKPDAKKCDVFLENLGHWLYGAWGRPDEENQPLKEHVQSLAKYFEPYDGDHILIWKCLGDFLWQVGSFKNAIRCETTLYDTCLSIYGEESVHTGFVAKSLAECYHNSGQSEKAFTYYKQAEKSMRASGAGDDELAWICERLAMCYTWEFERDLDKALEYALEAAAIRKRMLKSISKGENAWRYEERWEPCDKNMITRGVALAYQAEAGVYIEMQKYSEAVSCADEAIWIIEHEVERSSMSEPVRVYPYVRQALSYYHRGIEQKKCGETDLGRKDLEKSLGILQMVLEVQEKYLGSASQTTLNTKEYLGDVYDSMESREEALKLYQDVEDALGKYFSNDQRMKEIKEKIKAINKREVGFGPQDDE